MKFLLIILALVSSNAFAVTTMDMLEKSADVRDGYIGEILNAQAKELWSEEDLARIRKMYVELYQEKLVKLNQVNVSIDSALKSGASEHTISQFKTERDWILDIMRKHRRSILRTLLR